MIKNVTQKFIDFNLKISGKIFPEKFNNLLKKFLTVEVVLYIFFGVLTTVVNIGLLLLLHHVLNWKKIYLMQLQLF